jgi:lysophospholipase L1-like esterase
LAQGARSYFDGVELKKISLNEFCKEFTTNKKGYRSKNEFSSETKNWLCVGGSTTECTYLDDKETWYTIAEKKINSKSLDKYAFASIGRSGHTTNNHYAYIKKTIENDTEIDGIVLMCGINDFLKTLADTTKQFSINEYDSLLHLEQSGRINFGDWYAHSAFLFAFKINSDWSGFFLSSFSTSMIWAS